MEERRALVAGVEAFYRCAPPPAGRAPVLYVHGNPTSSDDWVEILPRTGGIAPDLPGFGRSGKPAEFPYSIEGYSDWLEALLAHEGVDRYSLVVHDWGAAALGLAMRSPERVERLAIVNAVPLLPGYRWHRLARIWRTPLAGELFMGFSTRWGLKQLTREATVAPGPAPDEFVDRIWERFDHGTQRAILKLYRSAPVDALARAGERLGELRCPALVLWGVEDPYIPSEHARGYAQRLGGEARLELVEGASHWPWLDRPETLDTIARFLLK
ncbi:MAG: alpha/beta hydrolase [Thermoleophilaceae bacterium]|nr:alpha/beta hydrolase [Thermoleophilaceae bacterium]